MDPVEDEVVPGAGATAAAEEDRGWAEGSAEDAGTPLKEKTDTAAPDGAAAGKNDGAPAVDENPDGGKPKPDTPADDPVEKAKATAKQEADKARQVELDAIAERERKAREAAQPAATGKIDLKATIETLGKRLDDMGLTFTNPDPDNQTPAKFSDVLKEFPTLVELSVALAQVISGDAVNPVASRLSAADEEAAFNGMVTALENPEGAIKLPAGTVAKLLEHPDFNAYFEKDNPDLLPLLQNWQKPELVAMALRAFAAAKKIDLGGQPAAPDPKLQQQQQRRQTTTDLHRSTIRQHGEHRGGGTQLTPEEEEDAGWAEGQEADKKGSK